MINLLPQIEKERILKEKKKRLIFIINFLILLSLFSFLLTLLAIEEKIHGEVESQKIILQTEKEIFKKLNLEEIEKKLKEENANISKVEKILERKIYFTDILKTLTQLLPENVYFKNISLTENFDKNKNKYYYVVSVLGFSKDRVSLFELKKNLEKEKSFSNLDFPPSNWITPENIDFRFVFEIWQK